ncbi:ABC transporter permease subunit [Actinophytocola sediminis]
MRHALRAEWTKLRTLRSNAWLAAAVAVFTVGAGLAAVLAVDTAHCPTPARCFEDVPKLALTGVWFGQIAAVVLAVGVIGGEYGTGLIQATLAARPRRFEVLAGKAVVVAATVLVAATVGVLGALLAGRIVLPGKGFTEANGYQPLSLADPATLRAAVGTVLYLTLVALLALGVATIVRGTAGALSTVLSVLLIAPMLVTLVGDPTWRERLEGLAPMTAGLAIQATTAIDRLPIAPWAGIGVLAAWAVAAMTTGGWLLARRDQ